MTTLSKSKSDELKVTQNFEGGYINLPAYTTAQRDAYTPASGEFPLIVNSTTSKLNFWNGSAWEAITSA